MKKIIFLLSILITNLFSEVLLSKVKNNILLVNDIEYLKEINGSITLKEAIDSNKWQKLPTSNISYKTFNIWTKLVIKNDTNKEKEFILKNPRPGMDKIHLYIYSNVKPMREVIIGDLIETNKHEIKHNFSVVKIKMKENEKIDIYAKLESIGPMEGGWIYQNVDEFIYFTVIDSLLWGLFGGIILAMVIYYFTLFLALKYKFILAYIIVGLSTLIYQFSIHGIFRIETFGFSPEFINSWGWISITALYVSINIFTILFFDLKKNAPLLYKIIILSAILVVIVTIIASPFVISDNSANFMLKYVILIWYIVLFITFIKIIKLKSNGYVYYILGQVFFNFSMLLQMYTYFGHLTIHNLFEYLIVPIGSILELMFLSLAMGEFLKKIEFERKKFQIASISQSKFNSIGKSFAGILHQWKTPIARLGHSICDIESATLSNNTKVLQESVKSNIHDMYMHINSLQSTINDFGLFLKNDKTKTNFLLNSLIDDVCRLFDNTLKEYSIKIEKIVIDNITINSYYSLLFHVCMTIIDNAIDILVERKIKNPSIIVTTKSEKSNFIISIEDNGGGVRDELKDRVFEPFFSNKKGESDSFGLGLMIAKMLTEEKLGGTITLNNSNIGACFEIVLPNNSNF